MVPYIFRRVLLGIFVIFVVATLTFFMLFATADPVSTMLAGTGATPAEIAHVKSQLGYDRPLWAQYLSYLLQIVRGDFGVSVRFRQPDLSLFLAHAPYTIALDGVALVLTLIMAIPIGIVAAVKRGSVIDRLLMMFAAAGQSVPSFVWGPIFILVIAVHFGWLPVGGVVGPQSVILPAVTLALYPMARIARLLRSSMLDVLSEDYVRTARAKGLPMSVVNMKHALKNALLPVVTMLGLQIAGLIGGTVVVETVFGWPGLGYFATQALLTADFPLVQTIILFITAGVVAINILVDITYAAIDPRIRFS